MTDLLHRNRWTVRDGGVDLRRPVLEERALAIPALPAPITVDLARSALVVIDVQNDFCHPDGWLASWGVDVAPAAAVLAALRELVPAARAAGMPVLWVNWGARPDRANLPPGVVHAFDPRGEGRGFGSLLPNGSRALTRDSWGVELAEGLVVEPGDLEIEKHRMSGFPDTELDSILRTLRVDTLFFAGVNSDQCVYATLVDAAAIGYDVVLVDGASGTTSPAYCHDATLYNTRQCYGFTTDAAELSTALRSAPGLSESAGIV